jgi:hypothetical protein
VLEVETILASTEPNVTVAAVMSDIGNPVPVIVA